VASSGLGTINHTLLSLNNYAADVPIAGVILNGPRNASNRAAIEHYGRAAGANFFWVVGPAVCFKIQRRNFKVVRGNSA